MYGAVPLRVIKEKLVSLSQAGRLDKVKMLSKLRPSGVYGGAAGLLGSD